MGTIENINVSRAGIMQSFDPYSDSDVSLIGTQEDDIPHLLLEVIEKHTGYSIEIAGQRYIE